MRFITSAAMKELESATARAGVSYYQMMENAGSGAARVINERYRAEGKRITVLCGRGNNAGDGLVCARELAGMGAIATVCFTAGEVKTEEAKRALAALNARSDITYISGISEAAVEHSDIIVDAIYGTGFRGESTQEMSAFFARVNACGSHIVSLDIPSGVEADTGRFASCITAELCITFGCPKPANIVSWSRDYAAETALVPIGTPDEVTNGFGGFGESIDADTARALLPRRSPFSHKGDNGRVLLVAGSQSFPGAALLAVAAALRCGVGYVDLASTEYVCGLAALRSPEAVHTVCPANDRGSISSAAIPAILLAAQKCDAVAIGCGMTDCEDTEEIVRALLRECGKPMIIDADAINALGGDISALGASPSQVLLTPHPGEFSRLERVNIVDVENSRFSLGETKSGALNNTAILLKGPITAIHSAAGDLYSFAGCDGLAKGGSGDVLTGIIGGLTAAGARPADAAALGAYIHGHAAEAAAGELTSRSMLPTDVIDRISGQFAGLFV